MSHDLETLLAEREITQLIYAYCAGIDTGNFDDTARLFADGTWFINAETPLRGFEEAASFLHDNVILYEGVPATRHTVSNIRIELQGEDRTAARAQSTVIVFQCVPGAAPHIMFQGAYDDTFVHTEAGWRFEERRMHADGTGDMSLHLKSGEEQAVGA